MYLPYKSYPSLYFVLMILNCVRLLAQAGVFYMSYLPLLTNPCQCQSGFPVLQQRLVHGSFVCILCSQNAVPMGLVRKIVRMVSRLFSHNIALFLWNMYSYPCTHTYKKCTLSLPADIHFYYADI